MIRIVAIIFLLMTSLTTYSQTTEELYMSKEFRNAYSKKTRSYTGEPGENYFINKTDYKIKVDFNPKTRLVKGSGSISYTNNSKDTLEYLYLNLYMDLFKKGNARDWDMGQTPDLMEGVSIKAVKINNIEVNIKVIYNRSSMLTIKLPEDFLPNTVHTIDIDWDFIFPGETTVRSGQYGDKNFFIAYWYPKIAVYDDIMGWNTRGHTGIQEFYNDFGDYDVEITVPGDYNVWSTAVLQNTDELFNQKYLDRIKESKTSDNIVHVITKEDREKGKILKKSKKKVWKFKSENTPDFAFALSKTYLWDATSVMSGGRRISINTAYKENSKDFKDIAKISRDIVKYFSEEMPGIPYPYPQFTAFNGGGGMEFPGMINDGDSHSENATMSLTAHEMGHSYYPFCTGLNEQKYAWMDEGLISFFPQLLVKKYSQDASYVFFKSSISSYNNSANSFVDVPLMVPSDDLSRVAYRFQAYTRSSTAFYELYRLMGQDNFAKGLQLFTERWKGKHPTPYDLFFTFNEVAGQDLAWFWEPWFFEMGAADLSVGKIETTNNKTFVSVDNESGFPVAINLKVIYTDNSIQEYNYSSEVWKNNQSYSIEINSNNIREIILDTETSPDAFPENNIKILD